VPAAVTEQQSTKNILPAAIRSTVARATDLLHFMKDILGNDCFMCVGGYNPVFRLYRNPSLRLVVDHFCF
jgi:hypothetical protein